MLLYCSSEHRRTRLGINQRVHCVQRLKGATRLEVLTGRQATHHYGTQQVAHHRRKHNTRWIYPLGETGNKIAKKNMVEPKTPDRLRGSRPRKVLYLTGWGLFTPRCRSEKRTRYSSRLGRTKFLGVSVITSKVIVVHVLGWAVHDQRWSNQARDSSGVWAEAARTEQTVVKPFEIQATACSGTVYEGGRM
ncbi:unnamed protein product [Pylaiella littoralis]